jgi:hypothetical protein
LIEGNDRFHGFSALVENFDLFFGEFTIQNFKVIAK